MYREFQNQCIETILRDINTEMRVNNDNVTKLTPCIKMLASIKQCPQANKY